MTTYTPAQIAKAIAAFVAILATALTALTTQHLLPDTWTSWVQVTIAIAGAIAGALAVFATPNAPIPGPLDRPE